VFLQLVEHPDTSAVSFIMTGMHTCIRPLLFALLLLNASTAYSEQKNGFILDHGLVPAERIFRGGPAKDGIPAIDNPVFISVLDAGYLQDSDRILGIEINDIAKAYPISILNWHEIVNDSTGESIFTITYCPLCGTGMAFSSDINGQTLSFGVSGLLYNSDVLLYDRESESLWSQIAGKAVTGKYKGTKLTPLPLIHTTWSDWKRQHPSTRVLSRNTGYTRNYDRDPYNGYQNSRSIYFPVLNKAPSRYHPKERVLGLTLGDSHKAYPYIELNKNNNNRFTDSFNGKTFIIHWNKEEQSGHVTNSEGEIVPTVQAFWFAWYAFHPDTKLFSPSKAEQ